MNVAAVLAVAALAFVSEAVSVHARVHRQIFCWVPESEFPVACEDLDDDEEPQSVTTTQTYGLGVKSQLSTEPGSHVALDRQHTSPAAGMRIR